MITALSVCSVCGDTPEYCPQTRNKKFFDAPINMGDCPEPDCVGELVGKGSKATGRPLANGYRPTVGEVISIDFLQCTDNSAHWQVG